MLNRRLVSVAALGLSATFALTGCSGKDVANKAQQHASALATNSQAQALKSKAATAAKSKLSDITGSASATGASGSASAATTGATVDLGTFATNRKAKVVGAFYTKRRQGKPGPFLVTVTGVKARRVSVCVGPKGTTSRTVIVAKGKVKAVRKGTASCA
ncbi:MAG TPA: hypothetical protein VJ872_18590 [Nocardioides sp.]|nr:hypothetical protein [Nocardioides sp.]